MWNVGNPVEMFIGREQMYTADVYIIHNYLMDGETTQHEVVIYGHGGTGKTVMALHYCEHSIG